jgi:hypothetical protein
MSIHSYHSRPDQKSVAKKQSETNDHKSTLSIETEMKKETKGISVKTKLETELKEEELQVGTSEQSVSLDDDPSSSSVKLDDNAFCMESTPLYEEQKRLARQRNKPPDRHKSSSLDEVISLKDRMNAFADTPMATQTPVKTLPIRNSRRPSHFDCCSCRCCFW